MNHIVQTLPILILCPHQRCNCRCVMCDIWKRTDETEMPLDVLRRHLRDIESLGVKWVVFSGGEPLMHSDLFRLCSLIRSAGIRVTILTTGLLLERHAQAIVDSVDEIIVSLDGSAAIHDRIRRIPGAYGCLVRGIRKLLALEPAFPIAARSTIQRLNHRYLSETARAAKSLGCQSISFLAADLGTRAFNRSEDWSDSQDEPIALSKCQIPDLETAICELLQEWRGFVLEDAEKFSRIVRHFRAHLGLAEPVAPLCNAPWVSAVVEADGSIRPCFFHNPIGKLGAKGLLDVVNGFDALAFRSRLDVATNPICKCCVCSLNWKGSA